MLHLRLVVPPELSPTVLDLLGRASDVTNLWHLPGGAVKPAGDLISCDVAKEQGTAILDELRDLQIHERGSIAVENVDASLSRVASEAE
ncbi:MAG: DUF389 domain-containing protein, partial [Actinomycetota bacterium]